ncbi:hypothetical protein [Anabaena azotica]|uniref:Uncharacterized protein n=1 Tax=Anabaena azotica FACHB-119 TaxID=947527 RepID=A0ABR8DAM0_9NOST|nr:hypothetical protein [Anabaena azotica]MBD2504227.1 hypothetical protein [Anabaena azotica FACHB-119]
MQPIEASVLKAFIFAIYQLDTPLPDTIQEQIREINLPQDISKLKSIANSYPPLAASYKQVRERINTMSKYRSKGKKNLPEYEPEPENTEIENVSREIEDELVKFEQEVDDTNKLVVLSRQIFQALNPVKAAKDVIKKILSL